MIRLHERQLAMLVFTFAYATQFNALPGSSRAPRVQYYLEWAPIK